MKSVKGKMIYPASTKCHAARQICGYHGSHGRKLMLHLIRSKHHKVHLVEELRCRGVTDAYVTTRWDKLCKMMKVTKKDDKGWFVPLPDFSRLTARIY